MTIYSTYTYYSAGMGDFIRSLYAVFVFCLENNINHHIYIPNHPLNECIKCLRKDVPSYPMKIYFNQGTEALLQELNLCKEQNYDIILLSNLFRFYSFTELRNQRYLKLFSESCLQYSDKVIQRSASLKSQIPHSNQGFVAIHIRCGDKFMESMSQCQQIDQRLNPNSELLITKFEKTVAFLQDNYAHKPIILFSDVQSLKKRLCQQYQNVHYYDTDVHHITCYSENDNAFVDTVAEFKLLSEAECIIMLTFSGFAFWSAFVGSVSLYVCQKKPSNDELQIVLFNDEDCPP